MASHSDAETRDTAPTKRSFFERLHSAAEEKNAAGKERRLEIERAIASKKQPRNFSDKKIPLSQADEFYYRAVKHAVEKDGKLAAAALERDRSFKAQFNFNDDLQQRVGAMGIDEFIDSLRESSDPDQPKIPLSQAEEFYYKSVRHAMEKDEKLAAIALERDRSYKAQFKFNEDIQERSGICEKSGPLGTVNEDPDGSTVKKIPRDQADEFYYKCIRRAMEKDERLAVAALERDRSYHAQFNFNNDKIQDD